MSILLDLFFATLTPLLLVLSNLVPVKFRFKVFGACFMLIIPSIIFRQISLSELGIRINFTPNEIFLYLFVALLSVGGALFLKKQNSLKQKIKKILSKNSYLFLSLPAQQFVYFAYTVAVLNKIEIEFIPKLIFVGVSFGAMHLPWKNWQLFVITTIAGILWGAAYLLYPNLFLSFITHFVCALILFQ